MTEEPERPTPHFDKVLGSMDALIKSMRDFADRPKEPTRDRGHQHQPPAREKESREQEHKPISLEKEAPAPEKEIPQRETPSAEDKFHAKRQERLTQELDRNNRSREVVKYDSQERRQAIANDLQKKGVSPELAAIRMLLEVGHGQPPEAATRPKSEMTGPGHARALDAQAREREARERENRERGRDAR